LSGRRPRPSPLPLPRDRRPARIPCTPSSVLQTGNYSSRGARRAAVLERSWNGAAATGGQRRQGQDRESRATSDQRRPARTRGQPRRGTVTPEVAGSSPVAPVSRSACTSAFLCLIMTSARDVDSTRAAVFLQTGDPPKRRKTCNQHLLSTEVALATSRPPSHVSAPAPGAAASPARRPGARCPGSREWMWRCGG
jgi:hypothetical protein